MSNKGFGFPFKKEQRKPRHDKKKTTDNYGARGFASGGLIEGAGTGTSDDIEAKMPVGSYIMPADSTEQLTPEFLDALGKPADVNVSNGEHQLPPEQIYALGLQVLDQMKGATHSPVAKGFNPEDTNKFADGGLIDDEALRRNQTGQQGAGPQPTERITNDTGRGYKLSDQVRANARADATRAGEQLGSNYADAQQRADAHRAQQEQNFNNRNAQQKPSFADRASAGVRGFASKGRALVNAGGKLTPYLAAVEPFAKQFDDDAEDRFARRFAVNAPEKNEYGKRALLRIGGAASDLGSAMTFGQADRLYRDKQQDIASGEKAGYLADGAPLVAGAAGAIAGNKTGQYVGKGFDLAASAATRGRYKGNKAETGLKAIGGLLGGGAGYGAGSNALNAYRDGQSMEEADAVSNPSATTQGSAQTLQQQSNGQYEQGFNSAAQGTSPDIIYSPDRERIKPDMVDGIPTFTNEHAMQIDPNTINSMPTEAMSAISPSQSASTGDALRAAAERGDWEAVENYYASQGGDFNGKKARGFAGPQSHIMRDSRQQNSERSRIERKLSQPIPGAKGMTARQRETLASFHKENPQNNLGFKTAQMQDSRAAERNALDAERLSMEQAAKRPQIEMAKRLNELQQAFDTAKTPEEREAISKRISSLTSKERNPKDNYLTVGGGQMWDEQSGTMRNVPQRIYDIENQQFITEADNLPPIEQNPAAAKIFNNTKLSRQEKIQQLRELGYNN